MANADRKRRAAYAAKHYRENAALYKERAKKHRQMACERNVKFVREHLSRHPCVDCGEVDWVTLDFDHVRGKKDNNIATLARRPVSMERLKAEMDKCEIRCSNCHRRKTYWGRPQYKSAAG